MIIEKEALKPKRTDQIRESIISERVPPEPQQARAQTRNPTNRKKTGPLHSLYSSPRLAAYLNDVHDQPR